MPFRQVLAAVGQSDLMQAYQELFSRHGITVAQTLLTRGDLADRQGYLNARNTLLAMLELRVVPIVNENDVVAVDEIEGAKIGDNDNLSALVANLVDADLLVLLTDIGRLYTADPRRDARRRADPARGTRSTRGSRRWRPGRSKRRGRRRHGDEAAGGAPGDGRRDRHGHRGGEGAGRARAPGVRRGARDALSGRSEPHGEPQALDAGGAIGQGQRSSWTSGAAKVLREDRRSLLPAGVRTCRVRSRAGRRWMWSTMAGSRIACGIANYAADEILRIKGLRSDRIEEVLGHHYGSEVVHRDNLVLL